MAKTYKQRMENVETFLQHCERKQQEEKKLTDAAHAIIVDPSKSAKERIAACSAMDKAMGLTPEETGPVDWDSVVDYCDNIGICAICGYGSSAGCDCDE